MTNFFLNYAKNRAWQEWENTPSLKDTFFSFQPPPDLVQARQRLNESKVIFKRKQPVKFGERVTPTRWERVKDAFSSGWNKIKSGFSRLFRRGKGIRRKRLIGGKKSKSHIHKKR
jgi:hypothetical protein